MQHLEATLSEAEYNRARLAPKPGEFLYLCLSDLRLALDTVRTDAPLRLLDFGCGGSPYKSLFPNADYIRADYTEMPGLDVVIVPGKPLPLPDASFDLVLSTQVLEHVADVDWYLGEARRVLKPDGRLILTTHGFFQDHGCPYDFFRWTADGLRLELTRSGFKADSLSHLTCGMRMALTTLDMMPRAWRWNEGGVHGIVMGLFLRYFNRFRGGIHLWADRQFADQRMVANGNPSAGSYIILFINASPSPPR